MSGPAKTQISALKRFKITDCGPLLSKLSEKYRIFVPTKVDQAVEFKSYDPVKAVEFDYSNSVKSPKEVVFPQTEEMFSYSYGGTEDEVKIESQDIEAPPTVIFGIRPCDAHGMTKADHNFKGEFEDPYYLEKRKNTILIGMGCNSPDYNCFCSSMGGGPFSRIGLDALIIQFADFIIIEVLTEAGSAVMDLVKGELTEPPENIEEQISELENNAEGKISRKVDIEDLDISTVEIFEEGIWSKTAERCIGCGICVFLCPTCRCFDVQEEASCKHGRRVRLWDSCQFPEYTVHGSGHNPRPERTNRVRNRILCRLKYTKDKFGVGFCSGCGRCITYCPVNIDIVEIYDELSKRGEKCKEAGN